MPTLPRGGDPRSPIHAVPKWIRRRSRGNALEALRSRCEKELERAARESGVSISEFRKLTRLGPNAPDLLERRMAALDLNPSEVAETAPRTFHNLQRVCSLCEKHGRCLRDLARDPSNPAWEDYCPNAATLMALDAMPWASRREW